MRTPERSISVDGCTLGHATGWPVASSRFAARNGNLACAARRLECAAGIVITWRLVVPGIHGAELEVVIAQRRGGIPEGVVGVHDQRTLREVRLDAALPGVAGVEQDHRAAVGGAGGAQVGEVAAEQRQSAAPVIGEDAAVQVGGADDRDRHRAVVDGRRQQLPDATPARPDGQHGAPRPRSRPRAPARRVQTRGVTASRLPSCPIARQGIVTGRGLARDASPTPTGSMKGVPADDTDRNPTVAPEAPASPAPPRRLAPRNPTPAMASGGASSTLPDDVAAEQVQRLSAFSLVAGGPVGDRPADGQRRLPAGARREGPAGRAGHRGARHRRRDRHLRLGTLFGELAAEEVRRRAVADDAERGRHRPAGNLGHGPDHRDGRPSVVGVDRDPDLRDDRAEHAAQDAAGRRWRRPRSVRSGCGWPICAGWTRPRRC